MPNVLFLLILTTGLYRRVSLFTFHNLIDTVENQSYCLHCSGELITSGARTGLSPFSVTYGLICCSHCLTEPLPLFVFEETRHGRPYDVKVHKSFDFMFILIHRKSQPCDFQENVSETLEGNI